MDQHLGVSLNAPVKLLISDVYLVNTDLMRHDKAWLGFSGNDEVTKVAIVRFDVALACTE